MVSGLQAAYDADHVIRLETQELPDGFPLSVFPVGHQPVTLLQDTPGAGSLVGYDKVLAYYDASLLASGCCPDAAYTALGPGFFAMQGSGVGSASLTMNAGNGDFSGNFASIAGEGHVILSANGRLTINQNGGDGEILIENKDGQLRLSAYNGKGQLEYCLDKGPLREGWYMRNSEGPEQLLIPNEKQVVKIIESVLKKHGLLDR
jgi:hypothetical protein